MSLLQDFTDALSGEHYVSVSYVKPVLHLFNTTILAEDDNNTELARDVKKNILAYLNEKYLDADTDDLLDIASFLDPRFRTTYTKTENVDHVISRAVEEIKSLKDQQQEPLPGPSGATAAAAGPVAPPEEKRKKSLSSFFKKQSTSSMGCSGETLSEEENIRMELRAERLTVMQTLCSDGYAIRQTSPVLQNELNSIYAYLPQVLRLRECSALVAISSHAIELDSNQILWTVCFSVLKICDG